MQQMGSNAYSGAGLSLATKPARGEAGLGTKYEQRNRAHNSLHVDEKKRRGAKSISYVPC